MAASIAAEETITIGPAWRTNSAANQSSQRAADEASEADASRIGQRSKMPGTTKNSTTSVAITPKAAWKPNTRIGSSSLTTSDASPTAVVPAESVQGSHPSRMARAATPCRDPVASESMR